MAKGRQGRQIGNLMACVLECDGIMSLDHFQQVIERAVSVLMILVVVVCQVFCASIGKYIMRKQRVISGL